MELKNGSLLAVCCSACKLTRLARKIRQGEAGMHSDCLVTQSASLPGRPVSPGSQRFSCVMDVILLVENVDKDRKAWCMLVETL